MCKVVVKKTYHDVVRCRIIYLQIKLFHLLLKKYCYLLENLAFCGIMEITSHTFFNKGEHVMRKIANTSVIILLSVLLLVAAVEGAARYVYLSPSCYSDSANLTTKENYYIKKFVLECVEARLSIFADENDVDKLGLDSNNRKHVFIFIDRDFMDSVRKEDDEYIIRVQTYGMESASDDCVYEIHLSNEFDITFFGLDP